MANSAVASDLFSLDYEAKKLGCFTAHKFTVLELVETKIEKKKKTDGELDFGHNSDSMPAGC